LLSIKITIASSEQAHSNIKKYMTDNQSVIHGRFEVTVKGQILISHTWGPFNVECVHAYRKQVDLNVASLEGQRWAMLAVTIGAPLHTPASMAEMVNTILHQRNIGRCATAIVLMDVESEIIVKSMLSGMYVQAGEPHIFASDEASAITWLNEQIVIAECS
jgi:hypothetical protein